MTFDQLRIFVAVAAREHMTQAAHDLKLTQSAVSAAIASLEARYAVKLFSRVGRHIELTEAGRMFLTEARAVLARTAIAERTLADLAGLRRGSLSIYASQTIANYWLPPMMTRFKAQFPDITLHLAVANTEQVAAAVLDGLADIGLVEGVVEDEHLSACQIGGDRLIIVAATDHPLIRRKSPKISDLKASTWILRERGSGTRAQFDRLLGSFGSSIDDLNVVLELPSNEAVCAAVAAGSSATAISELAAASGLASGALAKSSMVFPARPFFMLRHRERYLSSTGAAFYELVGNTGTGGRRSSPH